MSNRTTPLALLSYPNVFTPKPIKGIVDSIPKYSCNFIFPEGSDVTGIQEDMNAAIAGKWGASVPEFKSDRICLRKGKDVKGTPEKYANCWVLIAKSSEDNRPVLVHNDKDRTEIIDRSELYGGCKVHGRISIYATDKGGPGVFAGLNGIIKMADVPAEERFDSREDKNDMFGDVTPQEGAGPKEAQPGGEAGSDANATPKANLWES